MKKVILFLATTLLSSQVLAADSVHSWGPWAQGIRPAAGNIAVVTPPPAQAPDVQFRPNETSAFARTSLPQASDGIVRTTGGFHGLPPQAAPQAVSQTSN